MAHPTDHEGVGPQHRGMAGEVRRRPAELGPFGEQVPEHLAEADDREWHAPDPHPDDVMCMKAEESNLPDPGARADPFARETRTGPGSIAGAPSRGLIGPKLQSYSDVDGIKYAVPHVDARLPLSEEHLVPHRDRQDRGPRPRRGRGGLPPARPARAGPGHGPALQRPGRAACSSTCPTGSTRSSSTRTSAPIRYDNYDGCWGDEQHLHRLLQAYAVERARSEARKKNYATTEQSLADGSILVEIEVGGSA